MAIIKEYIYYFKRLLDHLKTMPKEESGKIIDGNRNMIIENNLQTMNIILEIAHEKLIKRGFVGMSPPIVMVRQGKFSELLDWFLNEHERLEHENETLKTKAKK